jgi:zinc/manganese transport system substrate-binding protein
MKGTTMQRPMKVIAIAIAILGLAIAPMARTVSAQDDPIKATATFSILGDLVQNVGGDLVEVQTLVGADSDAHTFEPAPADIATLGEAEIIFESGFNFEPWLDGLIDASGTDAPVIVVSEGITPRGFDDDHHDEDEHHDDADHEDDHADEHGHDEDDHASDDGHAHDHGEFDPHVWQSAANAIVMVEAIRDALIELDPDHADTYEANAEAYIAELSELDAWITEQIATIPEDRRKLVTSHDTFGYYADRYGLEVIGTVLPTTTEAADPPAGEIAALIEQIEESGVPAIFTENVQNDRLMTQIAENAGVELAPPLYTDALGAEGSAGATYLDMMRYNTETIVAALSR